MSEPGELHRITLRPLSGSGPVEVRVRRALKMLLRTYRLRCVRYEVIESEKKDDATSNETPDR